MQTVKRSWLLLLNWGFTALSLICILASIVFAIFGVSDATIAHWGITPFILGLCAVHLIYTVAIYPRLSNRNLWLATIFQIIIYAIFFAAIIETSGRDNMVIRAGYVLFMFVIAMGGPFPPIAGILITWTLYVFVLLGAIPSTTEETVTTGIINIFVTIAGIAGWLVFRRHYNDLDTKKTTTLSRLLQQEQFKATVILESISDGVMVTDTKGTVQIINNSAALMLGWEQKEALHLDYRSLVQVVQTPPSTASNSDETAISICARTQKSTQKISLLMTQNQRRTYVDIVASPILEAQKDEAGNAINVCVGVIAVLRNVDKQKRDEEQRSEFISTASHEMRTPVASIQGFIELALNPKVATVDEKARGYLVKAHEASKHLGKLFQDLLTASKSEDGRLVNNPTIIEVGELLGQLVDHAKVTAEKKKLQITFETTQSTDKAIAPLLYIHADPERFREVITNLIDNAIKYTEHGMITVGASLRERTVVIRVSDTGMGIAAEDIPHLFQKFYRTDNSATREIGGTGLGLYISKQIIEMMGGQIWVESTPGAGSTFYVELPRVSPESVIEQSGA